MTELPPFSSLYHLHVPNWVFVTISTHLGHVGQALEVDIHVGPVPVHARDLDVTFEVSTKI